MIETGSEAPDFDLKVDSSTRVRLADFRGRRTCCSSSIRSRGPPSARRRRSTCRRTCGLRECGHRGAARLLRRGSGAAGVEEKLGLTYTLPSDFWPHGEAARAYGVFDETRRARARHVPDRQGRGRGLEPRQRGRHAPHERPRLRSQQRPSDPARYEWGDDGPPALVCLHGVTSHGGTSAGSPSGSPSVPRGRARPARARRLDLGAAVEHRAARRRCARGGSGERCAWLGHSFGGRVAYEVAARPGSSRAARPARSRDPAAPDVGSGRPPRTPDGRSYVSFEEGIERRYEESVALDGAAGARRGGAARSTSSRSKRGAGATGTARARSSPPTGR